MNTPGPWSADNGGDAFYGVFGPDGGALAYLLDCAPGVQWQSAILPMEPSITMRERFAIHEANATLMAAAPDLLDACMAAKDLLIDDLEEPGRTVFWKLITALKKTGWTADSAAQRETDAPK